ncbi:MAG: hypothetical protein AB8G11_07095 [Saprospiraceae bacterium]
MKKFYLWIYGSITLFVTIVVLCFFNSSEIISSVEKTLYESNRFLIQEIEYAIDEVEENVKKYPEYKEHEEDLKKIDSLFQQKPTENNTLFSYLANFFAKEEGLTNFTKNEKAVYLQNNLLSETWRTQKRYILAEYLKSKTQSFDLCCFCGPELIYINNKVIQLNKATDLQFGLSYSGIYFKNPRFWINGKVTWTKDGKTTVKQKATKSGWNDLKIKYQGEYENEVYTNSLTYRYFVCD